MQTGIRPRSSFVAAGVLWAVALAVAVAPAGARAGNAIVPHAAAPHQVQTHAVTTPPAASSSPTPASSPAPAPAPAPVPRSSSPGALSQAAGRSPGADEDDNDDGDDDGNGSGSGSGAGNSNSSSDDDGSDPQPGSDLPGADVPVNPHAPLYPEGLADYGSADCDIDCLQEWHSYFFGRIQDIEVAAARDTDPVARAAHEAAVQTLKDTDNDVKGEIRAEGGTPGKSEEGDASPSDGDPSQETGHAPAPAPQPAAPAPAANPDPGPIAAPSGFDVSSSSGSSASGPDSSTSSSAGDQGFAGTDVLEALDNLTGGPAMSVMDMALNGANAEYKDGHGMFYPREGSGNDPVGGDGNGSRDCIRGSFTKTGQEEEDGGEARGCF